MGNIWKIAMFIWKNKDMLMAVIKEIMDLFSKDENVQAKAMRAKDCPKSSVLSELGQEANLANRRRR